MGLRRRRPLLAALLVAAACWTGCGGDGSGNGDTMNRRPVTEVLEEHADRIMKIEGVVGIYEGQLADGSPCITVMVKEDRPGLRADIPSSLDGYPVQVEIGGEIRPMR